MKLITSFFVPENKERYRELLFCLLHNLTNPIFDNITVIVEPSIALLNNPRLTRIKMEQQPTFNDFISLIDGPTVIANSDIIFGNILLALVDNECFALTRWELPDSGIETFEPRADSQDSWVFNTKPAIDAPFCMGVRGCDNRLAYLLKESGLKVSNPSLTVKTYHVHNDKSRNYSKQVIEPPYLLIEPTV
jgi:hypothetical protein